MSKSFSEPFTIKTTIASFGKIELVRTIRARRNPVPFASLYMEKLLLCTYVIVNSRILRLISFSRPHPSDCMGIMR